MDDLNDKLAELWRDQTEASLNEFWRLVVTDLVPGVRGWMSRTFGQLSDEDVEVCIDTAIESFLDRRNTVITNPASYIRTSVKREAIDLLRGSKELHLNATQVDVAIDVIEDHVPGITAQPSWAESVVHEAASRLPSPQRRVVEHMLSAGNTFTSTQAPAELGMAPGTYRSNMSRARSTIGRHILDVMVELGLDPRDHFPELNPIHESYVFALIDGHEDE